VREQKETELAEGSLVTSLTYRPFISCTLSKHTMAKGARSKVLKRNNTKKREKLQKFENRRLERISNKLAEIVNSNDNVGSYTFQRRTSRNRPALYPELFAALFAFK
jgi:hypothetical protein